MVPAIGFLITHIQADSCPAQCCNSSQLTKIPLHCHSTFMVLHNPYCATYLRLVNDVETEFLRLKCGKKPKLRKIISTYIGGLAMTTKI